MSVEYFLGVCIPIVLLLWAIIIGIRTFGKVKSYKVTYRRRSYFYHPVIEYYVDNKKYTFTTETGDDFWFKPKVGKIIKIKYDAKNPEIVCKRHDTDTIWTISIGLICIIAGSLFLYKYLLLMIQS